MEIINIKNMADLIGKRLHGYVAYVSPAAAAQEFRAHYGYMPNCAYLKKSAATGGTTIYFEVTVDNPT